MRIQRRITLGIGILFTMILLLGIQSVGYVRQLSRATGTILADNYNSLQYAGEMLRSLNDIGQDSISRHALRENLALQQQNITEISEKETTAALERHVASLSDPVTEAEIRTVREDLFRIMELNMAAIRAKMLEQVSLRKGDNIDTRIVVGMATCGIAAGARPVMLEFIEELKRRGIENATVSQTGCVGVCRLEPIVEVYVKGQEKVTYVHMTPEKVARVVNDHIVNGRPVEEYTIGAQG